MSVKKELYLLIKAAITAIPTVEMFGKFNNQYETEDTEQSFNNPSVFLEMSEIVWLPQSQPAFNSGQTQMQKSEEFQFTLHIGYWSHEDEEDKFLAALDLVDEIYRAITSIESDNINPIKRVSEVDDSDHTEPLVWRTTFSTMLSECGVDTNETAKTVDVIIQSSNI